MSRLSGTARRAVRLPAVLGLAACLLVIASGLALMEQGLVQPAVALAFAAVIAVGESVRITLPGDRETSPVGLAGSLAYAFLGYIGATVAEQSAWQVVAVTAVGVTVGLLRPMVSGYAPGVDVVGRRMLITAAAAFVYRSGPVSGVVATASPSVVAAVMGAVAVATLLLDVAIAAAVRAERDHAPYRRALIEEFRALAGVGSAIAVTGVLIALAAQVMGLWAVPVFGAPLLLVQFSVKRYTTVRSTYSQTIRSLSKVTELGGYTETGHLDRVASLSVAIGTELGMSDAELEDLERAALLHDIGQLSLAAPIPGGATSMAGVGVQSLIAHDGASVIRQTRVLDTVAEMVERQADPYRRPHEAEDADLPLGARIIRVVNAYDDLVGESPEGSRRVHALEQLRLGMVYDYDPRVVASLDRVLRRRD